jgi:hypothetical protein
MSVRIRITAVLVAAVAGLAVGVSACSGGGDDAATVSRARGRYATPEGSFCDVVLRWSDAVVGSINQFSMQSPDASDPAARKAMYLDVWDGLSDLSLWVDAAADRAPADTQAELRRAATRVRDELTIGRARAAGLPDSSYELASVRNGTLFTSTEKTRDVVYQTLDDLRAALGEGQVPVACGRHTEPVTLPVMTAP